MNQQSEHRTLTGKTAIITGASRGIGAAIALRLAQLGANVTIDYLSNDERAQHTKQHIENEADAQGRVITCKADVTDETQVNELAQTTANTFGGIDILINNALSHYSFDPRNRNTFSNTSWNDYATQLEGCLKGTYNTCTTALPYMRRQSWGRHRQHLQQPRRQPDRPLPRLHRSQRSTHRIHALAGAGGRSVGRHGERHRGRFDRGHGFEPRHHRRRPRAHHRADAFGQACHG